MSKIKKLWILAAIQVWVWPQLLFIPLNHGILISLFITMVASIIANVLTLVMAYDERKYNE